MVQNAPKISPRPDTTCKTISGPFLNLGKNKIIQNDGMIAGKTVSKIRTGEVGNPAGNPRKTTKQARKPTETQGPCPDLRGFCLKALTV